MLGSAEDVGALESSLAPVVKGAKIYMRQGQKPSYLQGMPLLQELISIIRNPPMPQRESMSTSRDRVVRAALEVMAEAESRSVAIFEAPSRRVEVVTDPLDLFKLSKGSPTDDLSRILSAPLNSGLIAGLRRLNEGHKEVQLVVPTGNGTEYRMSLRSLPAKNRRLRGRSGGGAPSGRESRRAGSVV